MKLKPAVRPACSSGILNPSQRVLQMGRDTKLNRKRESHVALLSRIFFATDCYKRKDLKRETQAGKENCAEELR